MTPDRPTLSVRVDDPHGLIEFVDVVAESPGLALLVIDVGTDLKRREPAIEDLWLHWVTEDGRQASVAVEAPGMLTPYIWAAEMRRYDCFVAIAPRDYEPRQLYLRPIQ